METTTFENTPPSFDVFKESTVQDILTNSEVEDINTNSDSFSSRVPVPPALGSHVSPLTENLILCSALAVTPATVDALNIACIVSVAPELSDVPLNNHDVIYRKIPILDSGHSRIFNYFDEAADLIHKIANSGGRTLVYCVAGVSRSASVCLAYLMKHHQMTLLAAYNYVKLRRPRIKPNCGFFKQLIEYEENLYSCNTVHMVYNDFVRMEIPDVYDSEYKILDHLRKRNRQGGRH